MTSELTVEQIRAALRAAAERLALDPASITSPTPASITARRMDGHLVRMDVSTYAPSELSR